jgi:gluconolactonase
MKRGVISMVDKRISDRRVIAKTGRPNGLALDHLGNLWVAESLNRSLLRVDLAGEIRFITNGPEETPFLWPNDLCFGPDGAIYLTDSGVLLHEMEGIQPPSAAYTIPVDGRLYRYDPGTGDCVCIDRGLRFANGIAWDPEGKWLYVSETLTGNIIRYRLQSQAIETRETFANVMVRNPETFGKIAGPDGMAFDQSGFLYVAVLHQGDITVLDPHGSLYERISLGDGTFPTNLAFACVDEQWFVVTEGRHSRLIQIDAERKGLPLYTGRSN